MYTLLSNSGIVLLPMLRAYSVSRRHKEPLLRFMTEALRRQGCRIMYSSPAEQAPFRITFETPEGERMGIVA